MINLTGIMSPHNHMDRTWGAIVVGAVGVAGSLISSSKNRKVAEGAAEEAETRRLAEQAKLDKQKAEYKSMKFTNPFANMENTFEDLTVNQQQAQFQAQQGSQQRANIMQNMKGAAGGSGIAGLAQALANQGSLQTQQISASIGRQESANQITAAKGAAATQTYDRQGQQWVQQANMDRQATLLGMQMGQTTGANMAASQAQANQMNAQIAQSNASGQAIAGLAGAAGAGMGALFAGGVKKQNPQNLGNINDTPIENWGGTTYDPNTDYSNVSDRKLKKNIKKISKSPSGLNIYSFEYKDSKYGKGLFQGVMSDEVPQRAVGTRDGYDTVNYSMLDVEFKQI